MTKEEVVERIINMTKNGFEKPFTDYCRSTNYCTSCPFHNDNCAEEMIGKLIGRLLKAEESQKAETNLEHYVAYYNNYDQCIYMDAVKLYNEAHRRLNNFEEDIEWLLEPYKPPKTKYKLSKFEYDLLKCFDESFKRYDVSCFISEFWISHEMHEKGYFKDIPNDVPIKDILNTCEVVEE